MKKLIALVLVLALAIPTMVMASPLASIYNTYVDGEAFVPLRTTAYAFNTEVEWIDATRSVIITFADGDYETVAVEAIGGFIAENLSWIPLEFAIELFYGVQEGANRPQIHGMLTRIEYNYNVAYIFGSMHAGQPNWFPLHPMVEDAMARTDIFGFEVDMNDLMGFMDFENTTNETDLDEIAALIADFMDMIDWDEVDEDEIEALLAELDVIFADFDEVAGLDNNLAEIMALSFLPDGLTLEDILPDDVFENFVTNFATFSDAIGLEYEDIATLTPIALTTMIEMLMLEYTGTQVGLGDHMVDGYVAAFARANNRPIMGFEDAMDQVRLVYDVPLEWQVYALVDFPDFETMLAYFYGEYGLAQAYERQDIDAIRAILYAGGTGCEDCNPLTQHMHYVNWNYRCNIYANGIAELLRYTEDPTTFFFTFGISHIMGGNAGIVLYLLEDMGFDVVPLWK